MAASGRTDYFAIPIYQLGDTCEYIPSYNNGMTIIDAQMQANKTQSLKNQSVIETQGQAINTIQNEITEINNKFPSLEKYVFVKPSTNTQNNVKYTEINQLCYTNNMAFLNLYTVFTENHPNNNYPVSVALAEERLIPFYSIAGNPFNLPEGATNRKEIGLSACWRDGSAYPAYYAIWETGGTTYIGLLTTLTDSGTITSTFIQTFFDIAHMR